MIIKIKNKMFYKMLFLFVLNLAYLPNSQAETIELKNPPEGLYYITGQNLNFGSYQGQLEIRCDNSCRFTRWISYQNYQFNQLQVQEIWQGDVNYTDNNAVQFTYSHLQYGYINRLDNTYRTTEEKNIKNQTVVYKNRGYDFFEGSFDSNSSESFSYLSPLEATPMFESLKQLTPSNSAVRGLKRKIVDLLLRKYQKDEFVKRYKGKSEFKSAVHYFIQDKTLLNFYQNNPNAIVLEQKKPDSISLQEALVKRNAYAYTNEQKENFFFKDLLKYHTNELGMMVSNYIQNDGTIKFVDDGDSALWTGTLVASMAFKYLKTGDPLAYQQMKKSLNGLLLLTEVNQNNDQFSRTLRLNNVPLEPEWEVGPKPYDYLQHKVGGNNDMLKGLVYGYFLGYLALNENETEFKNRIKQASEKLYSNTKIVKQKVWNKPMVIGLKAITTGENKYRKEFIKSYSDPRVWFVNFGINTTIYWAGITDWSGNHLSSVQNLVEIMMADALNTPKLKSKLAKEASKSWIKLKRTDRVLNTFITKIFSMDEMAQNEKNEMEAKYFPWAIHTLQEIPFPRPQLNVDVDHSQNPNWCISPFPRLPWKFIAKKDLPASYGYQGIYNYPIYELSIFGSNYLWKDSALDYNQSTDGKEKYSGVDYLHAYWLARFFNLIRN